MYASIKTHHRKVCGHLTGRWHSGSDQSLAQSGAGWIWTRTAPELPHLQTCSGLQAPGRTHSLKGQRRNGQQSAVGPPTEPTNHIGGPPIATGGTLAPKRWGAPHR
eukprot:CAMPEP_0174352788 /NCGR_PEP_ID=MMETSP0811_2-20130205/12159_1 /TAXON_ID=73025 ORGANISM="Eutreptiella gymnastica-like, Strain CCMP1594" /NCGR_SAMPLE_ID=MMETSP0811_2 /ASSEMBLY_ACC=CAM_ASM_000667 /LENGTH=105 /DNA_ID=CAMNT_0015483035 /DNA_START=417 /DNA_END=731 /DNA_ORIENTATION=+